MNNLTITNYNGQFVVDSREVAEMVGKRHGDLLVTIREYVSHLLNGEFRSVDFFIPEYYSDATGRRLPCYLITRRGCDMVANKMTGEKGVLFTAAYVTKFEEMEKQIKQHQIPQTFAEALRLAADQAEKIQIMAPKAEFYDAVSESDDDQSIQEAAKVLGTGEIRLFKYLRERGILMSNNQPYQEYINRGYFRLVQRHYIGPGNMDEIYTKTMVTGKGMTWLHQYIGHDPTADEILKRSRTLVSMSGRQHDDLHQLPHSW